MDQKELRGCLHLVEPTKWWVSLLSFPLSACGSMQNISSLVSTLQSGALHGEVLFGGDPCQDKPRIIPQKGLIEGFIPP